MRKTRKFFLLIGLLFCTFAQAYTVSGLNMATLSVDNASSAARQEAMPKALGQVLVKMSGNPSVMTLPAIQDALPELRALIQSYSYSNSVNSKGDSQLLLQVTFDKQALHTILQKAGQAVWSKDRPTTLVWLNVQDGSTVHTLSSSGDNPLLKVLQKVTSLRGVPILLPAMDLQDQSFANTNAGQSFDRAKLQLAEKRYATTSVLAGNITERTDGRWRGQWLLLVGGTPYRWENTAENANAVVVGSIDKAANLMASQLAVLNAQALQSDVVLEVQGVGDLADYSNVLKALRHLSPVAKVSVKNMTGSELLLRIKTLGGAQALTRALVSQGHFTEITSDQADAAADLYYQWNAMHGDSNSNNNVNAST